jgi:phage protein D
MTGRHTLPQGFWQITLAGADVSNALAPFALGVDYTDVLHGKSDEVTLRLADADGRWRRDWWPAKGMRLTLRFGWRGGLMQDAGAFEIDETEYRWDRGSGGVLEVKAQSAGITGDLRTPRNRAFEGSSLRDLVGSVALTHGLDVTGDVPDISFQRVTQAGESDLAFLTRIADEYGAAVAVKDGRLVFTDRLGLRDGAGVAILTPADVLDMRLKDRAARTARAAEVSYSDPATGRLIQVSVGDAAAVSGDTLRLSSRVETAQQARLQAAAALMRTNGGAKSGSLRLPGRPDIAAGSSIGLNGIGMPDGAYTVETARHSIDRKGGYVTELEIKGA